MSANEFGVTAASVRSHHFPNADAWTTASRPSSTAVGEAITEEAARMAAALSMEKVDASAILAGTVAYGICSRILRMQVAVRVLREMLGQDSALAQSWATQVTEWYAALAKGGASFLGDSSLASGTSDPDGPTWHGSELEQDSVDDMSNTIPSLRKDDRL